MGKKKPTADSVRIKRKGHDKKSVNPFEVKINRQKHDVLGRKTSKHDKGMPGLSRSKATKRRKATLLKEHEQQFKSNKFVDKRFGENDTSLSLEEKMLKRYAMERSKGPVKNKFSLNDDEELTHYGQSLAVIEKFDEPEISDNEEDDDDDKRAAAKLVSEQHFGGFLKKRSAADEDSKSWKEKMEDLITKSKKAKHDRQKDKEESTKLTEDMDEQWKDLRMLISQNKSRVEGEQKKKVDGEQKKKVDDYDIAVRELQFEMKGKASDRLKSDVEIAKEEKERLDKLESDRQRRMQGISVEEERSQKSKYRSADDLDDGFGLEPQLDFDYVSYKDGQLLTEDKSDDGDDNDEDSGSEEEDDQEEEEEIEEEDSDADIDNYEDLDSDIEDIEGQEVSTPGDKGSVLTHSTPGNKDPVLTQNVTETDTGAQSIPESDIDRAKEKKKKTMIEKAEKELPYTFKAPEVYDDLLGLLEGHNMESQLTIIDRIRKCHHPSLAEGNKQKLEALFGHLVQFYGDLCIQDPPQLDFVDRLIKPLYELTQLSPTSASQIMINNLADRQEEFKLICEKKGGRGLYMGLDTLLLFKLVALLFPTSDFYHHVTTPAMIFMSQMLSQCSVNNGRDVVAGLYMCNICLEFVSMAKRYVPAAISFLHGLLFLAAEKKANEILRVFPPFKPVGKNIDVLRLRTSKQSTKCSKWSLSQMLSPTADPGLYETDEFRVTAIQQCVILLEEYSKLYTGLPSFREIFMPVIDMCSRLPTNLYPQQVQTTISSFTSRCQDTCDRTRSCLMMERRKPRPLKMFEPKVEDVFEGKRKGKRGNRDFNEKQKLIHKHKKEMKGARRELKKDTQFLARQKLNEQMDRDSERKRKVKEIFGGLAAQEGDYQKMKHGHKVD